MLTLLILGIMNTQIWFLCDVILFELCWIIAANVLYVAIV